MAEARKNTTMPKEEKLIRSKGERVYTRAQSERQLANGADPENFTKHANYHVRRKAWVLMGSPLPESLEDQNKFLVTLQGTPLPKDADAEVTAGYYQLIRQRILKEVPRNEVAITAEDAEYLKGEPVAPTLSVQE